MEDRKLPFPAFNYYLDEGRNPQSGEKMKIPASKVPAFKAGKTLKVFHLVAFSAAGILGRGTIPSSSLYSPNVGEGRDLRTSPATGFSEVDQDRCAGQW